MGTAGSGGRDRPRGDDARFWAFACMWAIADIVHLANQHQGRLTSIPAWLNLLAAVAVLRRPGSVDRLVLLGVTQLAYFAWVAPRAPDHAVLALAVNLVILITYVALRSRSRAAAGADVLRSALPAIRAVVLIGYSAAALAKYNSSFFDSVSSCASFLADKATFGLLGAGGLRGWTHVAMAVGPETLIPLLLIFAVSRRYGVRVGMAYHFGISLSPAIGVWDFTGALLALFPLFLATAETDDLVQRWLDRRDTRRLVRPAQILADGPPAVPWIGLVLAVGVGGWVAPSIVILMLYGFFTVYAARVVLLGLRTIRPFRPFAQARRGHERDEAAIPNVRYGAAVVAASAMILYVAMPYIGLRTTGVFTMFSNLRTEQAGTNHFFLPSVHVVDLQDNLVMIVASNEERLDEIAQDDDRVPWFEVERALGADPDLFAIVGTNEGPVRYGAGGAPVEAPSWIARKFLQFRAIPPLGESRCTN